MPITNTPKRAYSRAFTPRTASGNPTKRRLQLQIDKIPPALYDAIKDKAARDGISLRALVLGWLKEWTEQ